MTLADIQREAAGLDAEAQRKLRAFLASLALQQEGVDAAELSRRVTDRSPENWVSSDEARKRLSALP